MKILYFYYCRVFKITINSNCSWTAWYLSFIYFCGKMNYFSPNFMSWEIKIRFLSEFCSKKIECHKPFSTLNYECSHAVTNNTSIIIFHETSNKVLLLQIFPVAVRCILDAGGNLSQVMGLFVRTREELWW